MKAKYTEITYHNGKLKKHGRKTVRLPFTRISARALIVRRSDGAIFGVRHEPGKDMALPGGGLEDGETPAQALLRELQEEDITLIVPDEDWQGRFGVDYYDGSRELNFWFLIAVDDVQTAPNREIHEGAWIPQTEDLWHPHFWELIISFIHLYLPSYARVALGIKEQV